MNKVHTELREYEDDSNCLSKWMFFIKKEISFELSKIKIAFMNLTNIAVNTNY